MTERLVGAPSYAVDALLYVRTLKAIPELLRVLFASLKQGAIELLQDAESSGGVQRDQAATV